LFGFESLELEERRSNIPKALDETEDDFEGAAALAATLAADSGGCNFA
jgi:hypothetical protein